MDKLSYKEMKHYYEKHVDDLLPDKQVHINHEECSAGADIKKRLYMMNTGSVVLFKCHHCGYAGAYRLEKHINRAGDLMRTSTPVLSNVGDTLSREYKFDSVSIGAESFPTEAKLWLYSYGFNDELIEQYRIKASFDGIYLPVYDHNRNLCVIQKRMFSGNPKYLTEKQENSYPYGVVGGYSDGVYVFTEDILSAYKVASVGYQAVPLLGTTINDKLLEDVSKVSSEAKIIVWLDSDDAGVFGAIKAVKQLRGVTKAPIIDLTDVESKQPKELSDEVLKNILSRSI